MLRALPLYFRASAALAYAEAQGLPGLHFANFGRRLGRRLLPRRPRLGARYLLNPVNSVRFFEFHFAGGCLPELAGLRCLDVSSPRLFTLYQAERNPQGRFSMFNPDAADLADTRAAIAALGIGNVSVRQSAADVLRTASGSDGYDCIWSLSVIEHIDGAYDDRDALRWMFEALRPGGRLIVTVPVDRKFWNEYRDVDSYGTQRMAGAGNYFFQRFYDETALTDRLCGSVGYPPVLTRWFGEKTPGHFHAYIQRWLREGGAVTVDDPRDVADHYQEFESWQEMPGVGVAGLFFEKPF